jgi:hypothetical protein
MNKSQSNDAFEKIITDTTLTDLEKLVHTFELVTREFITHSQHEVEVAQAMGDKETAVREQIKSGVMHTSRQMFSYCFIRITGKRSKVWGD